MNKCGARCQRKSQTPYIGRFQGSKCTRLASQCRKTAWPKGQRRWLRTPFSFPNFGVLTRHLFYRRVVSIRPYFGRLKQAKSPFSGAVR